MRGTERPRLIVVEPEQANCLRQSAQKGELVVVDGKLETLMAGLAYGEVSPLAWDILATSADDFMTLPEKYVPMSMRLMAQGLDPDESVEAGESAFAGVGALLTITKDVDAREALGIGSECTVLVFGTKSATDPDLYAKLIAGQNV